MRDNEEIIKALAETQSAIREGLIAAISAGASPNTLRRLLEAMSCLEGAGMEMGDRDFGVNIPIAMEEHRLMAYGSAPLAAQSIPDFCYIAEEAIALLEKKVYALTERVEKIEAGGNDG